MKNESPPAAGKAKGAIARAQSLSPERRKQIAAKAAESRWHDKTLTATHGSPDRPLVIGDIPITCFVLEDSTRVITQSGFIEAVGIARGGSMVKGMNRLELFVSRKSIEPHVPHEIAQKFATPIIFKTPMGLRANGFEATLLADFCEAVLKAREDGILNRQQFDIAARCELLMRGFARVGIVALVDEATGFQYAREKEALSRILEAWVAKELQAWVQTFPEDYYRHLFRLRGLEFPTDSVKRPQYFGTLTNDIVYSRLAPGVLDELRRVTPRTLEGRPKAKYFQSLTTNLGYPKLREHLGAVVALMRVSKGWTHFVKTLNEHYPRVGDTIMLPMDYEPDRDDGSGL